MVQCLLQFGTDAQREEVLVDLLPKLHEVAKTPYGHFCVLKAIAYCTGQNMMKKIVAALQKHFVSLSTHAIGARTVESITQLYPLQMIKSLKGELYGKNFVILCPELPKNLHNLMEMLPNKREAILDHMRDLIIQKFITKTLLEFTYTHHLLWEYIQEITGMHSDATDGSSAVSDKDKHRMEELVSQLGDSAPKLLSTKPGARAMSVIIAHASAKDRKRILKSLKGHCLESLLHDSAYMGIIRLVDVTDDTVNIQKSIFDELKSTKRDVQYTATGEVASDHAEPWVRIAQHKNAHKLLLRLLVPSRRCFEPDEATLFNLPALNSKKDPVLKRKEHLLYIKDSLVQVVLRHMHTLVRSKYGHKVVEAVVQSFWSAELCDAVARVYSGLPVVTEDGEEGDEMEDEAGEEEDEEDEEEEEGGEDEAMDEDGDGEEGEEEEDGNEDGDDAFHNDEEYQEQLEEAEADRKSSKQQSKGNKEEDNQVELLAIEEDVTAHALFKRLMQWEAAVERSQNNANVKQAQAVIASFESSTSANSKRHDQEFEQLLAELDKSLWEASENDCSVAKAVLNYLTNPETETRTGDRLLLLQWLKCNRACFSLLELFHVPSMLVVELPKVMSLLTAEEIESLDENTEGHSQGRKLLFALNEELRSSAKPKATPAKKAAAKGGKKK
eukprot:gene32079-38795_t